MNSEKLTNLARVPRVLSPEMDAFIKPAGTLYEGGCLAIIAGGLVTVVCVGLALFGVIGWPLVGIGPGLMVLGKLVQVVVKPSALALARKEYSQMPLALGAVVQANRRLYEPGNGDALPAIMVHIDPADPQVTNAAVVVEASRRLRQLKAQGTSDPSLQAVVAKMHNETSHFVNESLPDAVYPGIRLVWSVTMVSSQRLPKGHLEEEQVLPLLIWEHGPWLVPPGAYM